MPFAFLGGWECYVSIIFVYVLFKLFLFVIIIISLCCMISAWFNFHTIIVSTLYTFFPSLLSLYCFLYLIRKKHKSTKRRETRSLAILYRTITSLMRAGDFSITSVLCLSVTIAIFSISDLRFHLDWCTRGKPFKRKGSRNITDSDFPVYHFFLPILVSRNYTYFYLLKLYQ